MKKKLEITEVYYKMELAHAQREKINGPQLLHMRPRIDEIYAI